MSCCIANRHGLDHGRAWDGLWTRSDVTTNCASNNDRVGKILGDPMGRPKPFGGCLYVIVN
jgi:hypothetical protein